MNVPPLPDPLLHPMEERELIGLPLSRVVIPPVQPVHFELRSTAYGWLMLAGIIVSIGLWSRLTKRDDGLIVVYVGALVGAFLGAKVVYLLAEGWLDWNQPDRWQRLATGKTILGGLLGGYWGVELSKRWIGYGGITGDWFAVIAPVSIVLGRMGCLWHGCCLGRICQPAWFTLGDATGAARWPAVPVEMLFNLTAILAILALRQMKAWPGQHFHIYLMAYGVFRLIHEFARETPKIVGTLSGYQFAALAVALLGLVKYAQRRAQRPATHWAPAANGSQ